jgi:hypothetical protein
MVFVVVSLAPPVIESHPPGAIWLKLACKAELVPLATTRKLELVISKLIVAASLVISLLPTLICKVPLVTAP